jgi:hypothetical protein
LKEGRGAKYTIPAALKLLHTSALRLAYV